MVHAVEPGRAAGDEAGEHEGGRGAEVGAHHAGALEFLDALDDGGRALLADAGAHAVELADVQEAVGEDPLGDHAHPVADRQQRHELRLDVGGEAGERLGRHLDGVNPPVRADEDRAVLALDLHAHLFEAVDDRDQVVEVAVLQFQFAVGDGGGDHERAALDAVGDDPVLGRRQPVDALDPDLRRAVTLDLGAHLVQKVCAVRHFRLARGADQHGLALRERGGRHDVDRAQHGRALRAAEVHAAPLQAAADLADDVAALGAELGAELLEPADVEVDRAVADRAPAGDADDRPPALGQERPEHADAGAHRLDDVVAGLDDLLVGDLDVEVAVEGRAVAHARVGDRVVAVERDAQLAEEPDHRVDVGQARHALERGLALGDEARGQDRQRAVLAAADLDFAFESVPAPDEKAVHRPSLSPKART